MKAVIGAHAALPLKPTNLLVLEWVRWVRDEFKRPHSRDLHIHVWHSGPLVLRSRDCEQRTEVPASSQHDNDVSFVYDWWNLPRPCLLGVCPYLYLVARSPSVTWWGEKVLFLRQTPADNCCRRETKFLAGRPRDRTRSRLGFPWRGSQFLHWLSSGDAAVDAVTRSSNDERRRWRIDASRMKCRLPPPVTPRARGKNSWRRRSETLVARDP